MFIKSYLRIFIKVKKSKCHMQLCEEVILYLKFLTSNFKIFTLPFSQKFKYIINNTSDSVHSITTNIYDKFSYINKQCEQYIVSNWKRRQCMNHRRLGAGGLSKIHRSGSIFWLLQAVVHPLPGRISVGHIPATCRVYGFFRLWSLSLWNILLYCRSFHKYCQLQKGI